MLPGECMLCDDNGNDADGRPCAVCGPTLCGHERIAGPYAALGGVYCGGTCAAIANLALDDLWFAADYCVDTIESAASGHAERKVALLYFMEKVAAAERAHVPDFLVSAAKKTVVRVGWRKACELNAKSPDATRGASSPASNGVFHAVGPAPRRRTEEASGAILKKRGR